MDEIGNKEFMHSFLLAQCAKAGCAPPTATSLKRVSATWLFARKLTHLG